MKRNKLRKEIFNGERHIADLFITDIEIVVLMEIFTKVFYLFFILVILWNLGDRIQGIHWRWLAESSKILFLNISNLFNSSLLEYVAIL